MYLLALVLRSILSSFVLFGICRSWHSLTYVFPVLYEVGNEMSIQVRTYMQSGSVRTVRGIAECVCQDVTEWHR
jgi:hypothetical protein